MAGRTTSKHTRVYIDGYDMSGYTRSIGPLTHEYDTPDLTVMTDSVKGYLPSQPTISPGVLNGIFDNTATSGLHVIGSSISSSRVVTVAIGDKAAPAEGDPVFCGEFLQLAYTAEDDGGASVVNIPFGPWEAASLIKYHKPWGTLAHPLAAADSDGNSSALYDDAGGSTSFGGYMVYHVTAGDGTATIKMQHAATSADSDAADLGGCTTGEIDCSSVQSGIVTTTANTTTVNQYIRWQIVTGTATTVTFALSFVRALF